MSLNGFDANSNGGEGVYAVNTLAATLESSAQSSCNLSADERCTIAVIGAGAAGTSFLYGLVKRISAMPTVGPPRVVVLEPQSRCGPGTAYGADTTTALLNRPNAAMSVDYTDPGHFRRWLGERESLARGKVSSEALFVPRSQFGDYLTEVFDAARNDLHNLGGTVEVLADSADAVEPGHGGRMVVRPSEAAAFEANKVVLCLGSVPNRDPYGLQGVPGYVAHPYPLKSQLDQIKDGASVLVLGTGLTAVDVALALGTTRRARKLVLASRAGLLPDVRCDFSGVEGAPNLVEDVHAALSSKDRLSLREVAALLNAELVRRGTSLRAAMAPFLGRKTGSEQLRHRLDEPYPAATAQRCIVALTPLYSRLWRALDVESRRRFLRQYWRIFSALRSPMPPSTARRLTGLAEEGILQFHHSISDVRAETSGFRAWYRDGSSRRFDATVNATGRGIDVDAAGFGSLLDKLVKQGLAYPHALGGLDVDPTNNEVLGGNGPTAGLHVVGDLSSGVHFHTSSMEYVATQAQWVAEHIASTLSPSEGHLG